MKRIFLSLLITLTATSAHASIICKDRSGFELDGETVSFEIHGEYGIYNTLDFNGSGVTQNVFLCEQDRKGYHSCYMNSDRGVFTFVLIDDSTIVVTLFFGAPQPITNVYDELECKGSL